MPETYQQGEDYMTVSFGQSSNIDGFLYCAAQAGIDFKEKKTLIFGSGEAAKAARLAALKGGAYEVLSLSLENNEAYAVSKEYADAEIIINAPSEEETSKKSLGKLDLSFFPSCTGLIDQGAPFLRTALMQEARKRGIASAGGLYMLACQGKSNQELFKNESRPDGGLKKILPQLRKEKENIIIIGMPGSGKSCMAKLISEKTGRPYIDLDTEIVKTSGRSIPDIFKNDGEAAFRKMEREHVKRFGGFQGAVIATGGGVVKSLSNYPPLRQNGRIYCLNREFENLDMTDRPLSSSTEMLRKMFIQRQPLYKFFADVHIDNNGSLHSAADEILKDFYQKAESGELW